MVSHLPTPNHPIQAFLQNHYTNMESFRSEWDTWFPMRSDFAPAKGILHLKKIATDISEYWKEQGRSPNVVSLPDPYYITRAINREEMWEPLLSSYFIYKYNINKFCRIYTPIQQHNAQYAQIPGPIPPTTASAAPTAPTQSTGGGRVNNLNFNQTLFAQYRDRSVRSAVIRNRVASGVLPAIPNSKVNQDPMCLAWHTKGQCNTNCPRKDDHVAYSDVEYQPLVDWCSANYPTS